MQTVELSPEYRKSGWSGYVELLSTTIAANFPESVTSELPPQVQIQLAWIDWMRQEGYRQDSYAVKAKTKALYQAFQLEFKAD